MQDLMSETGRNLYAVAMKKAIGDEIEDNQKSENKTKKFLTQLNYLPVVKGKIQNDNYNLKSGKKIVFKSKGDYVSSLPSSIASSITILITELTKAELTK